MLGLHLIGILIFFVSDPRLIKVQIISDFMVKYVTGIHHMEVLAFSGININ